MTRTGRAAAGLLAAAIGVPAAPAEETFVVSGGVSLTDYGELSDFGQLDLIGGMVEARFALPAGFYGMVHLRSEDGEGLAGDGTTQNDFLRTVIEGGWEFDLPLGFRGALGLNYAQADLDVGVSIGGDPVSLAVSREDYGARARLSRDLWGWAHLSGEVDVSPVDNAVGGIVDLATGPRLSNWSLALRHGIYPEISHTALMVRYHVRPPRQYPTAEPERPPRASIPDVVAAPIDLLVDSRWSAPAGVRPEVSWASGKPCRRPRTESAGCDRSNLASPQPAANRSPKASGWRPGPRPRW